MTDFLLLAFLFLVAGVAAVPIASRLGLGSVLGYLIAGIIISPVLRLLGVDIISIQHFAEFGVVMMLFLVGLELEPKNLWEMRAKLLGLGGGQVLATIAVVTGIALLFGLPWTIALATGLVLSLSSTAIVLQTLNERGLMKSDGGQSSFSVLLFQDIAVIPMLALLPLLAMPELMDTFGSVSDAAHGAGETHGGDSHEDENHGSGISLVAGLVGWQATLVTIAAVGFVVLAGNYLTRPLFRFIAATGLRELFTAAALLMVIGIALLMTLVGLSPALGTFIAGVVLANSEYRHELESDIDPFRGLLLGLFFMTVGAGINFALLFDNFALIFGLTFGLIAIKAGILFALGRIFGLKKSDGLLFGLGLAQAGEFGFVLLSFTTANSIIPSAIADQLLLIVALSMLLTPALFILQNWLANRMSAEAHERDADDIEADSHIIIAGVGRYGGIINRMLRSAGETPTVVDFSAAQLDTLRTFGVRAYYGDASRPDLLQSAGIDKARVLIVAIDDRHNATEIVKHVRQNHPNVHVIARAHDRTHVYELYAAGCRDMIRETFDSSVRTGRSAFEALGYDKQAAQEMAEGFVHDDQTAMIVMAELYDPEKHISQNEAYVEQARKLGVTMNELSERGPGGFGQLRSRLAEDGVNIDAILNRFREEAGEPPLQRPDPD